MFNFYLCTGYQIQYDSIYVLGHLKKNMFKNCLQIYFDNRSVREKSVSLYKGRLSVGLFFLEGMFLFLFMPKGIALS